nr:LTA synthase family protein [Lapidilactobacillus wuchangensis]
MKNNPVIRWLQTRLGFFSLLVLLLWLKTAFAYYVDFSLGAADILQHLLMIFNPVGTSVLLISFGLYFKRPKVSYAAMLTIYILSTILLFSNIVYYRSATDFLTFNTILSAGKVAKGLGKSTASLLQWHDVFLIGDIVILIFALVRGWLKIDQRVFAIKHAFTVTTVGVFVFLLNLTLSEANRPQLLTRTFDRNYIVKYLGIDTFLVYDGVKTAQNNQIRASADGTDINKILNYTNAHQVPANVNYFGKAKGKNVIIIHLESFQQFLIDFKVNGQEVTPFLNSLYHDQNSLSFNNFFHQVGQGRTADAENMLENSVFGLPEGTAFTTLGSDNTYQAAPAILEQNAGYTSAVFHGNVGSFWNRNHVYKNIGYDYFFDQSYYNSSPDAMTTYGIKDKLFFAESIKYLEQLQQPFYTKFITVSNHTPYVLSKEDNPFETSDTSDKTVNNYFQTAHYLDESLKEFFNYLDSSGLAKNSLIMLYGDHYGLSSKNNTALAPLLNSDDNKAASDEDIQDTDDWTPFDNTQLQRVPLIFHMPGLKGGIQKQYGGEIDVLPTLLHLLGQDTSNYVMFGQDLLSKQHQQLVAFRNNNFVSDKYTVLGGKGAKSAVYDNQTGEQLTDLTDSQVDEIDKLQDQVTEALSLSDSLNYKNLLRFYTPNKFVPVNPENYNYLDQINELLNKRTQLGNASTSLYSQLGHSSTSMYHTDAPEITDAKKDIEEFPDLGDTSNSQAQENSQTAKTTSQKK